MFVCANRGRVMLFRYASILLLLTLGCESGTSETPPVNDAQVPDQIFSQDADTGPLPDAALIPDAMTGPVNLPTDDDVPANAGTVATGSMERWAVLRDGRIVSQSASVVTLFGPGEVTWTGESEGDLVDALLLDDTILVLTTTGLFSLTDLGLETSPLDALLNDPARANEGEGSQGWFADSSGLSHWSDGNLRRLTSPELAIPWERAHLAPGRFRGAPALWVGYDQTLVAIGAGDTSGAWRFELGADIRRIAATSGGLFLLFDDRLTQLDGQETWTHWVRPESASLIAGHPDATDLWISNGVGLWQLGNDGLRARLDVPVHTGLKVNAAGAAFLKGSDTIYQVIAGRFLVFAGLEQGARLGGETTVTLEMSNPDQVESLTVQIDATEPRPIEGPPWSYALIPQEVGPGSHAMSVSIRYTDGGELTGVLDFLGPPTWEAEIGPLNDEYCAACHGEGGSAHLMSDADAWRSEIAAVVDDVETGRMPYGSPMLDPELIDLIRAWRDTGLLER